jgi:folylpolyglutamate synthase/dihydropteroate synthase
MPATDVASEARQAGVSVPLTVVPDPCDALQQALETADLVVVAGSMFVIGELLPHLPAVV